MILELLLASAMGSVGVQGESGARLQDPPSVTQTKSIAVLWRQLGSAIDAEDMNGAVLLCKAIADHPDFAREPLERRNAVTALMGLLYVNQGQEAAALPYLIEATERGSGTDDLWIARIDAHLKTHDRTAAALATARFLETNEEAVSALSRDFILQLQGSSDVDPEARFTLRSALRDAGWRDRFDSGVWMSLIDDLIERDRTAEAVPLVERITSSGSLIKLHAMRRYDDLRASAAAPELDIGAVLDAELARDRAAAEAADADLDARNTYASALLTRGRFEEALTYTDTVLLLPAPEPGSEDDSSLTWTMDTRARLLMELGRRDEATAQMEMAAKRVEGVGANVSQTINLGWFYLRIGENARAVETVKSLDPTTASSYGVMQAMHVRACAGNAMGDDRIAAPAFAHINQNWRDAPVTWVEAHACRGDVDGTAAALVAMLGDDEFADSAVSSLHTYSVDRPATDYDRRVAETFASARTRPDVIEARDRVGHSFTIPTTGSQF